MSKKKSSKPPGKVRNVSDGDSDSSNSDFVWTIKNECDKNKCIRSLKINGQRLKMIIDTGSEQSIIGSVTYSGLLRTRFPLKPTTKLFKAYGGNTLKCMGYFNADISTKEKTIRKYKIYVINGDVEPLLGRKATFALDILTENTFNVKTENDSDPYAELLDKYSDVFDGTGLIKGYVHKVTVDPCVKPVSQRLWRKPYAMENLIDSEMDKMLDLDVIEKSTEGSNWV
ncbi:uncharacterized protein LOC141903171 [Tubulanus polymorphus]|uniref:uncharacterized protein LOC141903171 n=1 Tax=Tubulanus polymorphus TaxID=672921 RepID=UPI003DA38E3F